MDDSVIGLSWKGTSSQPLNRIGTDSVRFVSVAFTKMDTLCCVASVVVPAHETLSEARRWVSDEERSKQ